VEQKGVEISSQAGDLYEIGDPLARQRDAA
jgi:hypothetical protein